MTGRLAFGVLAFGQSAALLAAGGVILLYSHSLLEWLIHVVGYERALGRDNVIRRPDGGILLTNPGAMARWWMTIVVLGLVEVTSSFTLAWLGYRHLTTPRRSAGGPDA